MTKRPSLAISSMALTVSLVLGAYIFSQLAGSPADQARATTAANKIPPSPNTDPPLEPTGTPISPPGSAKPPPAVTAGTGYPADDPRALQVPAAVPGDEVVQLPNGDYVGVGTGKPGTETAPALPPEPPAGGPCTSLPNWNTTKGEAIRAEKRKAGDLARDFAYPSVPLDISGPGTYTLDFGPLDPGRFENFPPPVSTTTPPEPIGINPPDDFNVRVLFAPTMTPAPTTIVKNGARYLRVDVTIDSLDKRPVRPCTGLVAWLT